MRDATVLFLLWWKCRTSPAIISDRKSNTENNPNLSQSEQVSWTMGMRILEPKKEHVDYNTLFLRGYPLQVLDNARRKGDWDQAPIECRFDCANQNSKFADRFDEKYMKLTYSGSSIQVNRTNLSNNSVLRQICSHVYLCSSCTLRPAGIWDVRPVSSSHWH